MCVGCRGGEQTNLAASGLHSQHASTMDMTGVPSMHVCMDMTVPVPVGRNDEAGGAPRNAGEMELVVKIKPKSSSSQEHI